MIRIELDGAIVAFTDRRDGNLGLYSGEDVQTVQSNIDGVARQLGLGELALLHQVHGGVTVDASDAVDQRLEGDALITERPALGLLITGADCPPVAIAAGDRLALLHCGWKPLAAGIVENTLTTFDRSSKLEAAIGPGISAVHYEVGGEVIERLGEDGANAFENGHLDLGAVIEAKLRRGGVDRIERVDTCTFADSDTYFSHRRDGSPTGRQAGIAWLN